MTSTMMLLYRPTERRPQASFSQEYPVENEDFTIDALEEVDDVYILNQDNPALQRLRIVAVQSGFVMSWFVLLSTVGVDSILKVLVNDETIQQKKLDSLISGATICILNLILAVFTLSLLRKMATHAYFHAPQRRAVAITDDMRNDTGLQETFYDIHISYVLGGVAGVSLLWTVLDVFMGLQRQAVFPATLLVLALVCVSLFHSPNKSKKLFVDEESAYHALRDASPVGNDSPSRVTVV